MQPLLEALEFLRARLDVAILEIRAGDAAAAIRAIELGGEQLEKALNEMKAQR